VHRTFLVQEAWHKAGPRGEDAGSGEDASRSDERADEGDKQGSGHTAERVAEACRDSEQEEETEPVKGGEPEVEDGVQGENPAAMTGLRPRRSLSPPSVGWPATMARP